MLQRGDESDNREANHVVLLCPTVCHRVSTSDENWSWVGVSINKKQPCVECSTQPAWLSQVDGTACEVQADTQAHHATSVARRTTHKPQPRPRWSRSGCLRGVGTAYCPTKESSRFSAERMSTITVHHLLRRMIPSTIPQAFVLRSVLRRHLGAGGVA